MRPPESWKAAPATRALAIATGLAWVAVSLFGWNNLAALYGGFIPAAFERGLTIGVIPFWLTPLSASFVHGGIIHLGFNLLIFLFCGRAVETIVGTRQLVLLYMLGAYAAAAAHYLVDPTSPVPMIGASGAISAVIGVYAMMFGRNRVKIANPTLALWVNALWLAAAWVILQLLIGFTFQTHGARIAIAAHVGGFLIGLALAKPLLLFRYRNA